jgi:hypothetical protein
MAFRCSVVRCRSFIGGSPFHIVRGPIHDVACSDTRNGGGDLRRNSAPEVTFYYHKHAENSSHYETIPDSEYTEIEWRSSSGWDNHSYAVSSPLSEPRYDRNRGHDITVSGLYHDMSGSHRKSRVSIQDNGGVCDTVSYISGIGLPHLLRLDDQVHIAQAQLIDRASGIALFCQAQHDSQIFIQQSPPLSPPSSNRLSQHDNSSLRFLSHQQRTEQHHQLPDRRRSALMNSRSSRVPVSNAVTAL